METEVIETPLAVVAKQVQLEPDTGKIEKDKWEWFGNTGHFICGNMCRFHLCTLVGDHLVSTVGQYFPDSRVREILAESRGKPITGRGGEAADEYLEKFGFEELGCGRTFETMVFAVTGERCAQPDCQCGLPEIIPYELFSAGYNTAGDAARGHMAICEKWASKELQTA